MKKLHLNSLFIKLAMSVLAGVVILAVSLSYINIYSSEQIFTDMFSDSQGKIFGQIEERFYQLYTDFAEIAKTVADDEAVRAYLASDRFDTAREQQIVYQMQMRVKETKIREYDNVTLFLAGCSGKSFIYNYADIISVPLSEIGAYPVTKEAAEHPGHLACKYMENGFTNTMKNQPVIIACRAIQNQSDEITGYVYLMIKESEIRSFYDYFLTGNSDIVVLNHSNEVISANNPCYFENGDASLNHLLDIVEKAKKSRIYHTSLRENGSCIHYLVQQFTNSDFVIAGVVNAKSTFYEEYDLYRNIATAILIAAGIISLIFILVRRQTQPLYRLCISMREQKKRDFGEQVPVEGTDEIRELSQTYNEMIVDLRHYIQRVMETEKAKRAAELHALQMQINPHYIYNTLTGIKWLVMKGNSKKSVEMLDAFTALLRNTISNADEFITIGQEEINLKNYVKINKARYGNKIQVEFYIQESCRNAKIPKMILQPFIENAFFHAFPDERHGNINVLVQRKGDWLLIETADDGTGMPAERAAGMMSGAGRKEHFTGIGIRNIDERLKLIYGIGYGVQIESSKDCGTTVRVKIPYEEMNQDESCNIM